MAQEQGAAPEGQGLSLNLLLANALTNLEQKRVDFPSLIAVLSLFNLFSVLNNQAQGQSRAGAPAMGGADLMGMLASLMAGGGKPGPEMLTGLLQKQGGKNLNPQLLLTLLSLLSEAKAGLPQAGGGDEGGQPAPQERRPGRGF